MVRFSYIVLTHFYIRYTHIYIYNGQGFFMCPVWLLGEVNCRGEEPCWFYTYLYVNSDGPSGRGCSSEYLGSIPIFDVWRQHMLIINKQTNVYIHLRIIQQPLFSHAFMNSLWATHSQTTGEKKKMMRE